MVNLLPPKNKEELLKEENWKIALILGFNFLAALVCFSLILYLINIFIVGEVSSQKIIYEQKEKEFISPQMQDLEQGLILFNKTFLELDSFYEKGFKATKVFDELSEVIPSEVYLTSLSFNLKSSNEKTVECALTGFSPSREDLLELKENLEEKPIFEEVYFPPSNWIKSTDINFQVTFRINPVRNFTSS